MRWILIIILCSLPSVAAATQSLKAANNEGYCSFAKLTYQRLLSNLRYFDDTLPRVPPDEARYLAKEEKAIRTSDLNADQATQAVLGKRFERLQSRPLFYVWRVRKELPTAMIEVRAVKDPNIELSVLTHGSSKFAYMPKYSPSIYTSEAANRLVRALLASSDLADLETRIEDLLDNQGLPGNRLMFSEQQFMQIVFDNGSLVFDMNEYAECLLTRLAPTKKFPPLPRGAAPNR